MNETTNIIEKEYIISIADRQIYGKLFYPDDGSKHPAVILSHGYNGCCDDFEVEYRGLAQNGYLAYAYDFCGGSTRSRSTLSTTQMTIFTEIEDLLGVFDNIKSLDIVDSSHIFLLGGSQGGLVTALTAEKISDQIAAMVLYYPALNIPDDWRRNFPLEKDIPETVSFWDMTLSRKFFTTIRDFNTFDNIGSYKGNILVIYGDRDPIIPLGVIDKAVQKYERIDLKILEGEGHGFSPDGRITAIDMVKDFLGQN